VCEFEQDAEEESDWAIDVSKGPTTPQYKKWVRAHVKPKFLEMWKVLITSLHEEQKVKTPHLRVKVSSCL